MMLLELPWMHFADQHPALFFWLLFAGLIAVSFTALAWVEKRDR